MKTLTMVIVFLVLTASTLLAQESRQRPSNWPSAKDVIEQVYAGERSVPVATAITTCPGNSPYGDTVWSALLDASPTPDVVTRLASGWSKALRTCGDPRLETWYQNRLLEARDQLSAGPFVLALLGHRTPQNIQFLKRIAFDSSREEHLRHMILEAIARGESLEERVDLYLHALASTETIPGPYDELEAWRLVHSPIAGSFVTGALSTIRRNPTISGKKLFIGLAHYEAIRSAPPLRREVLQAATAILQSPPGAYPPGLTDAARAAVEALERPF